MSAYPGEERSREPRLKDHGYQYEPQGRSDSDPIKKYNSQEENQTTYSNVGALYGSEVKSTKHDMDQGQLAQHRKQHPYNSGSSNKSGFVAPTPLHAPTKPLHVDHARVSKGGKDQTSRKLQLAPAMDAPTNLNSSNSHDSDQKDKPQFALAAASHGRDYVDYIEETASVVMPEAKPIEITQPSAEVVEDMVRKGVAELLERDLQVALEEERRHIVRAEEVKTTDPSQSGTSDLSTEHNIQKRRLAIIAMGVCLAIAGVVVGLIASRSARGKNQASLPWSPTTSPGPTNSPTTSVPSALPSSFPTQLPSESPTGMPSISPSTVPTTSRFQVVRDVLGDVVDSRTLSDKTTPQYLALDWLANEDDLTDDEFLLEDLVQRYVLAVLYLSTQDQISTWRSSERWLSSQPICDWEFVICSDTKEVLDLSLRK